MNLLDALGVDLCMLFLESGRSGAIGVLGRWNFATARSELSSHVLLTKRDRRWLVALVARSLLTTINISIDGVASANGSARFWSMWGTTLDQLLLADHTVVHRGKMNNRGWCPIVEWPKILYIKDKRVSKEPITYCLIAMASCNLEFYMTNRLTFLYFILS